MHLKAINPESPDTVSISNENRWDENCFYCMVCERPFYSPLYSITRTVEQMVFYPGERPPEADVLSSESTGDYCCQTCLNRDRDRLLMNEGVRVTFPGPGPIETCSRCGRPVDMTQPHMTWTEEVAAVTWGQSLETLQPTSAQLLAVKCLRCHAAGTNRNADAELEAPQEAGVIKVV